MLGYRVTKHTHYRKLTVHEILEVCVSVAGGDSEWRCIERG